MSNINKITANEQLFTELTPDQATVVEGGARLYIEKIKALKVGADPTGADDTFIRVNGRKIWGDHGMKKNRTRGVNYSEDYTNNPEVALWDEDGWWSGDEFLGSFIASPGDNFLGDQGREVSGSGSKYEVFYSFV